MILKETTPDVIVSGNFQETSFSMDEENQHIIFDILRSKVYKNNIGAICREVASNSRDAQREIGDFTTPIQIEISDKRKSFLYEDGLNIIFRDFGVGISPERVANVYTKYGASTKRNSNTQTGGFGLGAKTPFSYSDAFIIRTIVSEVEYVYSIYIDVTKKGKMALLGEEPAPGLKNLTEIIVPVKAQDLTRFESEVLRNTFFWKVRPKLINFKTNYQNLTQPNPNKNFAYSKPGEYDIYTKTQFLESHVNAIIDGIYYPVDLKIIGMDFASSNFALCLIYDNGELNISANRETLQYDDDTIKNIKDKINVIFDTLKLAYEQIILGQPNVFLAQASFKKFWEQDDFFKIACKNSPMKYTLPMKPGQTIAEVHTLYESYNPKFDAVSIYHVWRDGNNRAVRDLVSNIFSPDIQQGLNAMYWVKQDTATLKKGRLSVGINRALFTAHNSFILFIEKPLDNCGYGYSQARFDLELEKNVDKLLNDFQFQVKDYWSVEPEKIKAGARQKKETIVIKTFVSGEYDRSAEYKFDDGFFLEDGEPDTEIVSFYVEEERSFDVTIKGYLEDMSKILQVIDPDIKILISTKLKKKYFTNYQTLEEYCTQNAAKIMKVYERYKLDNQIMNAKKFAGLALDKSIQDDLDYLAALENLKSIKLYNISAFFKSKMPTFDTTVKDFSAMFTSITNRYPLIDNVDTDVVKDYVKLVNDLHYYKNIADNI